MKLCWIVVLVGISIILVFLYSLVAMSSRTERFIEQLMEEEGRKVNCPLCQGHFELV